MTVRAKFVCDSVKQHRWNPTLKTYEFNAVCADEVPENQRYHKYTPAGSLQISVDNPSVDFELGKAYYLDFTPAG
ncbi:hypothetical protein ACFWZU_15635 [Frateuria sp. GZRR33]|uniref:hypothetical protein n=1 Tax=Frateuria sp. GZRR33 TaxID=3351535 RepID=UPI003EDC94CF